MDEIASAAGVTKRTLYARFGSKSDLLAAVVDRLVRGTQAQLAELANPKRPFEESAHQRLTAYCRTLLDLGLTAEAIDLYRLLVVEAHRTREIVDSMELEIDRGVDILSDVLQAEIDRGTLAPLDTRARARALTSMINGEPLRKALFGEVWNDQQRTAWVKAVVDTLTFVQE